MLRFAASPSRDLHLGDLRIALINALVARQRGEGFILRITDRDPKALAEDQEHAIQPILEKFIRHDQVFHQSESLHRYRQLAVSLVERDNAFVCTCSPETPDNETYACNGACQNHTPEERARIYKEKRPYAIRVIRPDAPVVFDDVLTGTITTHPDTIGDPLLLRTDGVPSRAFAGAVDDMLGGISTVIRDEAERLRTAQEIHIRSQLGYTEAILYAHLPPLSGELPAIKTLFEEGFLPDAILNYLLTLGQTPPAKIFTFPDAITWFDLQHLSTAPTVYDPEALRELNREHLRRMDDKALSSLYKFADADIGRLIKLYLDEAPTLRELDARIPPIFAPKPCDGEHGETMHTLASLIASAPPFADFDTFEAYLIDQTGFPGDSLLIPLRRILTGAEDGPALSDLYPFIRSYITEVARCQP